MEDLGLVHIYTGPGKGKTTASLGAVLRAAGHGLRCTVLQFMKSRSSGEHTALTHLANVTLETFGCLDWSHPGDTNGAQAAEVERGMQRAEAVLTSHACDLLVLDELITALDFGLLPLEPILHLLEDRPSGIEILLTGRGAPQSLIAHADLVSHIDAIRHPYNRGIPARRGIEY